MLVNKNVLILSPDNHRNPFDIKDTTKTLPEIIEKLIVKSILSDLDISFNEWDSLSDLLNLIPEPKLISIIDSINNKMYKCRIKTDYTDLYQCYLLYYLPNNIFKIWTPLLDLAYGLKLNNSINVLDIGSGPGSLPIGIILFYKHVAEMQSEKNFNVNIKCIDSEDRFLQYSRFIINSLTTVLQKNLHIVVTYNKIEINDYEDLNEKDKYDLITMGNFLNSYEHNKEFNPIDLLIQLRNNLKRSGSLIIIEPGEKQECLKLKHIRNKLSKSNLYNIYSPCNCIWNYKEAFDCSCFTSYSLLQQKTSIIEMLHSLGLNKLKHKNYVAFNYLIIRIEKGQKYLINYNKLNYTLLSDLINYQGDMVNIKGIVRFKSKEGYSFSICDGTINSDKNPVIIQLPKDIPDYSEPIINNINMGEMISIRGAILCKRSSEKIIITANETTKIEVQY